MKWLSPIDYLRSRYERPTQRWRCGSADGAIPCGPGPSRLGRCPYAANGKVERTMCQPAAEGRGWRCTREEHHGGPCSIGPGKDGQCGHVLPPCQPVRSSRWRKSLMWRTTMALTVAALVLMLAGGDDLKVLQPGAVQAHHSNIDDCSGCHHEPEQWSWHAVDALKGQPHNDFSTCLTCHDLGPNAGNPHDTSFSRLHDVADAHGVGHLPLDHNIPGCGTCHREHGEVEIIAADREGCVSCHRIAVNAFDASHPAVHTPSQRSLIFNHDNHIDEHFRKPRMQAVAPDCDGCHVVTAQGSMQLAGFDQACSVCHLDDDILEPGGRSVGSQTLLAIPRIDADSAGLAWWPNCKTSGLNQTTDLPPMTRYLLNLDPGMADAMNVLDANGTRLDRLQGASEIEISAAVKVAAALQQLVEQWPPRDAADWLSDVPVDLVRLARVEWFTAQGQGCSDNEQWRALRDEQEKGRSELATMHGWYLQAGSRTLELGYKASSHADPWLRQLGEYAASSDGELLALVDAEDGLSCFSCHNVADSSPRWHSMTGQRTVDFDHGPHLTGLQCADCHQRSDEEVTTLDYGVVEIAQCVDCHQPGRVPVDCHTCHDYHRGLVNEDSSEP